MAATENVSQLSRSYNSIASQNGVITVFGYGVQVCVNRGHLTIEDGIGADRRHFRLPRVGHGLKRLVIIGSDGMISLAALRWLSDQNAAFVMLERDGKVLATTGPVRPSDAKLRRAQAFAANPANAMLNYLYALLESEARLAAAALGLDPGLGVLHVDTPGRDSLACDVMEAIRPQVDAYVLDWLLSQPLRREWFFEQRDGNCRLMASFAIRLSETAHMWARAIGPVAEWTARQLWSTTRRRTLSNRPPTR